MRRSISLFLSLIMLATLGVGTAAAAKPAPKAKPVAKPAVTVKFYASQAERGNTLNLHAIVTNAPAGARMHGNAVVRFASGNVSAPLTRTSRTSATLAAKIPVSETERLGARTARISVTVNGKTFTANVTFKVVAAEVL